jgi:ABC-type glycerol-3-phosphate transport system substrate-binding protein
MRSVYRLMVVLLVLATLASACAAPATPAPVPAPTKAPAVAQPTAAPAATKAPAPAATQPAAPAGGEGQVIAALDRPYLAYPKVKGNIRFLNCWGGARVPLIEQWIKDFNAIYPDIKITNDTTDCSKILQTTVTQVAGGDAPNVVMVQSNNFPFLAKDNTLMALDDLVKRDKIDPAWWYTAEWNARTYNGKLYGMPNVVAGAMHLIYFNTGLMEKVGWDPKKPIATWQDLEAMVEPAKKAGLFVMDPAKLSTGMTALGVLIYANGGQYWTDDLKTVTLNSKEAIEAAEWELKFAKAQAGKYESLAAAGNRRDVIQAPTFGAEKYVTAINGSWFAFQLNQQATNVKYGISLFPKNANNPKSTGQTFIEGGWAFTIPNIAKDKEAAWEWIKFVTASKYECDFIASQVRPSPVKRCNEDPRLKNSTPYWGVIQDALSYAKQVPLTDIHPKFQEILFEAEDNILYEKMAPKEAMDKAQAAAQALLDEWNKTRK